MSPTDINTRLLIKELNEKDGDEWRFNIVDKSKDMIKGEIEIGSETYSSTVDITDSFYNGTMPVNKCFLLCCKKAGIGGELFE